MIVTIFTECERSPDNYTGPGDRPVLAKFKAGD